MSWNRSDQRMKVSLVRAKYHSVWEPTNLMYISAYAKKNYEGELDIQILDGFFDNDDKIVSDCADSDIVGLSGTTPQTKHMGHLAHRIKNDSNRVIAGGYGPSLEPFKFLNNPDFDHLVVGEGEDSFLRILLDDSHLSKLVSSPPIDNIN